MKVLVTGGAGYVGSHVAHALVDRGDSVIVYDNLSTGRAQLIPDGVELFKGDMADRNWLECVLFREDVDAVVHCAGKTVVPESVADPQTYYRNNVQGMLNLLSAVRVAKHAPVILFSSTAAVYGPTDGEPVSEMAKPNPQSPYAWSKLMAEQMLKDAAWAYGLQYGILRYFNVAGADPRSRTGQSTPNATHLIKVACQVALGQRHGGLEIYGTNWPTPDGTAIRDYVHVSDLARAHLLVLDHLGDVGEPVTLNCGYGRGHSVAEVIAAVEKVSGRRLPVTEAPRRPGDLPVVVANAARLRHEFGWDPWFDDLQTIVAHALAWEKRFYPSLAV